MIFQCSRNSLDIKCRNYSANDDFEICVERTSITLAFSLVQTLDTLSTFTFPKEIMQDINHIIFYCPLFTPKSSPLRSFLRKNFPSTPND